MLMGKVLTQLSTVGSFGKTLLYGWIQLGLGYYKRIVPPSRPYRSYPFGTLATWAQYSQLTYLFVSQLQVTCTDD